MIATRLAALLACACLTQLAAPLALAAPRCTETCRQETARCATTRCATLRGKARQACLETCRGIGGCAPIRTLAYVLWQCDEDSRGFIFRQALEIRRRNCVPVTVFRGNSERLPDTEPVGACQTIGHYRAGLSSPILGGVQRLGVRPDGSGLVFEVSNVSPFPLIALTPEQQGFFFVRADGSGLRRLGPASRDPCSRTVPYSLGPTGVSFFASCGGLSFSPDGRNVVFTDLGPGPGGEMAVQVVTLALATGKRRQVTRLPLAQALLGLPTVLPPAFLDDETIGFYSFANPEGLNPQGQLTGFTVRTDGTGLRALPAPVVLPGS